MAALHRTPVSQTSRTSIAEISHVTVNGYLDPVRSALHQLGYTAGWTVPEALNRE